MIQKSFSEDTFGLNTYNQKRDLGYFTIGDHRVDGGKRVYVFVWCTHLCIVSNNCVRVKNVFKTFFRKKHLLKTSRLNPSQNNNYYHYIVVYNVPAFFNTFFFNISFFRLPMTWYTKKKKKNE